MRHFEIHNINEIGDGCMFVDGKPHPRFGYSQNLASELNPILLSNFHKVCEWIKKTYPKLNGEFACKHNVYHKLKLVVENGEAVLETGSWSAGFAEAISANFSESYTQGSLQTAPYRFINAFAFRNDRLEEFLSQWNIIKAQIIEKGDKQNLVFSNEFVA